MDLEKLDNKVSSTILGKTVLSHELLAFFYGTFLVLYELIIVDNAVSWMHEILILWAGLIFLYDLLIRKIWKRIPFYIFLVAFAGSACITTLINIRTGLVANVKALILTILPLVAFLPTCFVHDEPKTKKKSFIISMLGAEIVMFIAVLIALYMYFMRMSIPVSYNGGLRNIGINYYYLNDPTSSVLLYGLFRDTNHAAGFALCSLAYSIILLDFSMKKGFERKWKNVLGSIFAILNIVVQICYFPLANSRGGWLCLLIVAFILGFIAFYVKTKDKVKLRCLISIAIGILVSVCVYFCFYGVRFSMSRLSYIITNYNDTDINEDSPETNAPFFVEMDNSESVVVDKKIEPPVDQFKKVNSSFAAGRLDIWKDTFSLWKHFSIMGINSCNSGYYARIHMPDSILAQDKAIHNSYFDLLLDYGIVGFILLVTYYGLCGFYVLKNMFIGKMKVDVTSLSLLGGIILNAGVVFLLSCNFINTTAMYFFLLMFLSCILSLSPEFQKKK